MRIQRLGNVRPLVELAGAKGSRVEVDMESTLYTERTIAVLEELAEAGPVRAVIQAYLFRTASDIDRMNARRIPRSRSPVLAQLREIFPWIEQLKGETRATAPPDGCPRCHRTRRNNLHHKATRRDDDEPAHSGFGGPQHPQHGPAEGRRNPPHRGVTHKPQQDEKHFNNPVKRFAIAFDGPGPVHDVSLH